MVRAQPDGRSALAYPGAPGAVAGAAAVVALLIVLSATTGLGVVGWSVGAAYATGGAIWLTYLHGRHALGPAGVVTTTRGALVGGVAALAADRLGQDGPMPVLVALAATALALDAVDGQVARRTGTTSAVGARLDMEVDAFLILVLSLHVATSLGAWVLTIGALRYLLAAAAWPARWLRAELPPRFSRKVVAAVQGVVLVAASTSALPHTVEFGLVAVALATLVWSFARDVWWLWRNGPARPTVGPTGSDARL